MEGLNRYFVSSIKPPWTEKITICSTARMKHETDFEYVMNNTIFDLEHEKIRPKKKYLPYLLQKLQHTYYS